MSRSPSAVWVDANRVRPTRWAAEYYRKEYTALEDELGGCGQSLVALGDLGRLFTGPFGSELPASMYNTPDGVPLLRVQNIGELFLNESDLARIPLHVHEELGRSKLEPGDLALAKAGRLGAMSKIPEHIAECNITQHIVGVKVTSERVRGSYLAAFFLARYGRFQLERQGVGTLIKYLGIEETRTAKVAIPDRRIQDYIGTKVELAERCSSSAARLIGEANARFHDLLATARFRPSRSLTSVIGPESLSDRLNSEFYLPRYFDLDEHLRSLGFPVRPLGRLLRDRVIRTSTPERTDDGAVPCILTSDIDPQQIRWRAPSLRVSPSVHEAHSGCLEALDVVYTSVGPPVGEAAIVLRQFLPMAVGGDVSIVRHGEDLHPGFLSLFLNSPFGQMQNDRYARGIRQRRVYPEDVASFVIPVPPKGDQTFIGDRVVRYEELTERAVDLVNEAKADVEALINGTLNSAAVIAGKMKPPAAHEVLGA